MIRRRRRDLELSQQKLADRMGVSAPSVHAWERDKYLPEAGRLASLAAVLEVEDSELVRAAGTKPE